MMNSLRKTAEAGLLVAAAWASLATTYVGPRTLRDDTWPVKNLFDGQTAVRQDTEIELAIGDRDFQGGSSSSEEAHRRAEKAFAKIRLEDSDRNELVELEPQIGQTQSRLVPVEGLKEKTVYRLDLDGVYEKLVVDRPELEELTFTTRPGPRVTGLWRVDDTLLVSFSEPMDPETLELSQDSVDLLWDYNRQLLSAAKDRNLAEFIWDADGYLFRIAPLPDQASLWVKVSGNVRGLSGALLDGNGNGVPGEPEDDFVELAEPAALPTCYAREDHAEPCLSAEDAESWP